MSVYFLTYEPGLKDPTRRTSAGGQMWWQHLLDHIAQYTDVIDASENDPENVTHDDVLIVAWRWKLGDPERDAIADRMHYLLSLGDKLPWKVIIHDQDHKLLVKDIIEVSKKNPRVRFYAPQFFTVFTETLFYPNPYLLTGKLSEGKGFTYIGNNYERWESFVKYLPHVPSPDLYGNWLIPGKRQSPSEVLATFPNANFRGRLANNEVFNELKKYRYTYHFAKLSYRQTGFLTIRWAEAAAAGVIGFVPRDFNLPKEWRSRFDKLGLMPSDGPELTRQMEVFDKDEELRQKALDAQVEFVKTYFQLRPWFNACFGKGGTQ